MPTDHLQICDIAVLADNCLQDHLALNARLFSQQWIMRLGLLNQVSFGNALRNTDAFGSNGRGKFGNRGHIRARADDASNHSTQLSTGDSAGNTAN